MCVCLHFSVETLENYTTNCTINVNACERSVDNIRQKQAKKTKETICVNITTTFAALASMKRELCFREKKVNSQDQEHQDLYNKLSYQYRKI